MCHLFHIPAPTPRPAGVSAVSGAERTYGCRPRDSHQKDAIALTAVLLFCLATYFQIFARKDLVDQNKVR